jgi:epoxyqueuosine reductase QueG
MSDRVFKKLTDLLSSLSIFAWGIADISGFHPLSAEYPNALSIVVSYVPKFRTYSETKYHHLLETVSVQINAATSAISDYFQSARVRHYCIPQGGQDPKTLLATFPHKLAAVRAGLGWIGKSSLLVTQQCGPRVRLATLLIDFDLPCNKPITISKCGECMICVQACPYDCIKGVNWFPGIPRDNLLDAHTCSSKREAFRSSIGHKHECGLCLLACPFGNATGKIITRNPRLTSGSTGSPINTAPGEPLR